MDQVDRDIPCFYLVPVSWWVFLFCELLSGWYWVFCAIYINLLSGWYV